MIRITAKINIGNSIGKIDDITANINGNNISASLINVIGSHEQFPVKTFTLGKTKLGTRAKYCSKLNYYKGNILSDSNGNFNNNYIIDIFGINLDHITIVFDKVNNQHPNSIIIEFKDLAGEVEFTETYYDDDPKWTIPINSPTVWYTIKINNWNTPNSPLIISSIYADLSIDLDDTTLLDFERTIMDRSDIKKPSYGIISNTGSLSFIDKDGEVADYIAQQIISSKNVISAYLENTDTGAKEQIAYFNTQQWSYNNSQSLVNVSLKDDLEEWQDINVPAVNYDPSKPESKTAEWFYKYLYEKTPVKYKMLSFNELDSATKTVLSGTTIVYPLLESASLWAQWDKLCQLCFLHIYKRNDGRTVCVSD